MSVKQKFNFLQNMRVDVPHLKSMEDSTLFDFKSLLQGFIADKPYILRGFNINNPSSAINGNASNIQLIVDQATVWMTGQADGSFLKVPAGQANETLNSANTKVTGSFTAGAVNYISIQFSRATDPTTNDLVALWDVDAAVEFTKTVPLGLVLNYQFVINTSGFGTNSPVAIVTTDASNNVLSIQNSKDGMFRLGKGGSSPNASYNWAYSLPTENPLLVSSSGGPNPYTGGDWELNTFKDWMDAVMTEIKAIKGSSYWYSNGSTLVPGVNISDMYWDLASSTITGSGKYVHSAVTPGLMTWTSDIKIRSIFGKLTLLITAGSIALADTEVAYISLIRNQDFQAANTFSFANGSATVTATANVVGISAGNWIKYEAHNFSAWAQVLSVVGATITLTAPYIGATASGKALRTVDTYTMQSAAPNALPVNSNTYWFAKRDDNAFTPLAIDTIANSGLLRASDIATVKTTTAHGLISGQSVAITGASDPTFNGNFDVKTVVSAVEFTVYNPGIDITAITAGGGTLTAPAKIYLRYGGVGELQQGESAQISDETALNVLQFIGAQSESDITPPYTIVPNALAPYKFTLASNLTEAASALAGDINDIYITLDKPAYDEPLTVVAGAPASSNEVTGPILSGATLTLPLHSRALASVQSYVVSKGYLQVYLNGQMLQLTEAPFNIQFGWTEVGAALSPSNQIIINQTLVVGDVLTFRIAGIGGPGAGSGAADDNFNTLPVSLTPNNSDNVLIWSATDNAYRKQNRGVFLSGLAGNLAVTTVSANYTANASTDDLILVNTTAGNVTITLPLAATRTRAYYIKHIGTVANSMIITPNGVETIDLGPGLTGNVLMESFTLVSDGFRWWIV